MSKTGRTAALVVLVLVVAGATGAGATDGRAATNKLTGCRDTSTGTLDQVTTGLLPMGGVCGRGEVAVTWNKRGPTGPQGPQGPAGPAGGVVGWQIVSKTVWVQGPQGTCDAVCPEGKVLVGGGGSVGFEYAWLFASYPERHDMWRVIAESPVDSPWEQGWPVNCWAICVTAAH